MGEDERLDNRRSGRRRNRCGLPGCAPAARSKCGGHRLRRKSVGGSREADRMIRCGSLMAAVGQNGDEAPLELIEFLAEIAGGSGIDEPSLRDDADLTT